MDKLKVVKAVGELIVSVGVGSIIGNAIKTTTPSNVGKITKFCIGAGSLVLSGMIGDMAVDYTGKKFDEAVNQVKEMIKEE